MAWLNVFFYLLNYIFQRMPLGFEDPSGWKQINARREFVARLWWTAKDAKGKRKKREGWRSARNTMKGDRKQGGRGRERERECGRETEGDRRRKSLRHGWMQLVEMAAWAEKPWNLKQQLQSFSSWEMEARRLWIAHSLYCGISSRKHLLSSSFCWFSGFHSFISDMWPVVDINCSACVILNI